MGVFANIQRVLDTKLKTVSSSPFISWPNTKVALGNLSLTQYIRPTLLLSNTELYTLNDYERIPGIYQIDIYGKLDRGVQQVYSLADEIKEHFDSDRTLTQDGTSVLIQEISMLSALREQAWFKVSLNINFLCYNNK